MEVPNCKYKIDDIKINIEGSQIFTTTTVTNGSYDTVQSLDSQSTVFTKNQRSNGVKSKRKRSGAQRKKKKKAALSNLVFNFSAPSTSLQPIANTSGIGIKRLQSCMDSFEMNNYTKKIKLFHEKTQTEDDDSLTGAIVSMNIPLGLEQLILFRSAILKEIDKIIEGPMPKFHGSYIKLGAIVVKCADKASLHWLSMQITNISPWPSTMFKMISLNELHTYFRATVWIPSPLESTAIVLQRLQRQNPSLDTASWRIYSENLKTFEEGRTLFLGMPKLDFEKLQASNFKAYLDVSQRYLDAVNLHVAWLNTSEKQSEMVKNIVSSYNAILKEMKDTLITCMIEYGYFGPLGIAIVLLFEICVISFFTQEAVWTMDKRRDFIFLSGLLVCLGFAYISTHFANMNFSFPTNLFNAVLFLLIINIFYINNGLVRSFSFKFKKGPKIHKMFQIGALLHIVSLAGTSFIEEEHQTWYFFWTSTILYFLYYCFTKLFVCHQCNLTSIKMSSGIGLSCSNIRHHVKVCVKLFLLLIGHRVLCKLNSTGDKWAHLPDIAHWLKEDDSKIGMTSLLLFALILLIWIGYKCEDKNYKQFSFFLNVSLAICIYFRHMSNGAVMEIHPLYFSNGIYEVQTFWMITTFSLLSYAYRIILIIRHDKQRFASTILFFIINIWVKISAMLHQPYNVILLPMQIITSSTIDAVLRENNLLDLGILVHYWLGNVFYFYQGNSNSLASIDVAAGYVGLSSYMPFITGAYLIINTYSAIVLAYFLFIYHRQAHQTSGTDIISISKTYIAWRLMTVTVYIFIIHIQRFHLFVWSVFSPKLLYEAMYSVIMCCSVLLVLIVITLQVAMIPNY
ncbi:GPI ethanolamine phosphate transferase 2 isoform X2 [Pogonomyrmex barbatus]|uniref:GPI ethanolamine phosphate transferase 2 isoform X2 n=1 Tax=Pogonomyrmex barbatus TaxID=144034 RepID=A0A6I9VPN0_9HYME|nr:GPI ethanolamine phosphate transferase 2 isoform X2 [Pogonomyrmex barbatus]